MPPSRQSLGSPPLMSPREVAPRLSKAPTTPRETQSGLVPGVTISLEHCSFSKGEEEGLLAGSKVENSHSSVSLQKISLVISSLEKGMPEPESHCSGL